MLKSVGIKGITVLYLFFKPLIRALIMARAEKSRRYGGPVQQDIKIYLKEPTDGVPVTSFPELDSDMFISIYPLVPEKPREFREFCSKKHIKYCTISNNLSNIFNEKAKSYHTDLEDMFNKIADSGKHITAGLELIKRQSGKKYKVTNNDRIQIASAIVNVDWYLNKMKEELGILDYYLLQIYFTRCV
ncbi:MAG: hypothetical protein V3U72_01565 [Candidatus Aenigmarchaeota archaeon]